MKKTKEMKKLYPVTKLLIIAILLVGVSSCQSKKVDQKILVDRKYAEAIKESIGVVRTFMFTSFTPGASISVSHNNKIVWSQGFGYASKELNAPVTRETKFRIGDTSQMFTIYTLAKLQEQGLIDLNDSFYDYIPDFPRKKWDFSPLLLGINAAGFPQSKSKELISKNKLRSIKEYISYYENDSLAYEPNGYMERSDYSFALLGILAEEISDTHFQKLVEETILDTLGLKSTMVDNPYLIIDNRSDYYTQDYIARLINAPQSDLRFIAPSKGFISTADDLNKAGQVVLEPGFFSKESLDLFFTRHRLKTNFETNRGFGWWITEDQKHRKIYIQMGSTIGGNSMLMIYPDQKLVISVCGNIEDDEGQFPTTKIAEAFLKQIDPQETSTQETSKENPEEEK